MLLLATDDLVLLLSEDPVNIIGRNRSDIVSSVSKSRLAILFCLFVIHNLC